jgi:hypothetical protein
MVLATVGHALALMGILGKIARLHQIRAIIPNYGISIVAAMARVRAGLVLAVGATMARDAKLHRTRANTRSMWIAAAMALATAESVLALMDTPEQTARLTTIHASTPNISTAVAMECAREEVAPRAVNIVTARRTMSPRANVLTVMYGWIQMTPKIWRVRWHLGIVRARTVIVARGVRSSLLAAAQRVSTTATAATRKTTMMVMAQLGSAPSAATATELVDLINVVIQSLNVAAAIATGTTTRGTRTTWAARGGATPIVWAGIMSATAGVDGNDTHVS